MFARLEVQYLGTGALVPGGAEERRPDPSTMFLRFHGWTNFPSFQLAVPFNPCAGSMPEAAVFLL